MRPLAGTLVVLAALSGCGGSSRGLRGESNVGGVGFGAHCADVLHYEPGVLANDAKETAVLTDATLVGASSGLRIVRARAYFSTRHSTNENLPGSALAGVRVAPTSATADRAWHVVVDLRLPCHRAENAPPGDATPFYDVDGVRVGYVLGSRRRHVTIETPMRVCVNRARTTDC